MREVHISRARSHVHSDNELYDQSPEGELGQGAQRAPDRPLGRGPMSPERDTGGYPCRRHGGAVALSLAGDKTLSTRGSCREGPVPKAREDP